MTQAVLEHAASLRRAGKFSEAAKLYAEILKRDPKHFEALHALGLLHYQSGRLSEAERLIGEAILIRPDAADALYNRGSLLLRMNRLEEAVQCLDRAIATKPDYVEALANRGGALLRLGRAGEAFAAFQKVAQLRPDLPQVWASQGGALLALNRPAEALDAFEKALAIRDDFAAVWKDRAGALMALGREGEALTSLDRAVALDPGNADILYRRADLFLWLKRFAEAAAAYDAFLAREPNHGEAWSRKGVALVEMKAHAEALAAFDRAVALDPGNGDAINNRANVLFELKRYEDAARAYETVLALDPDLPYAQGFLIQCRMRVCDWSRLGADRLALSEGLAAGKRIIDPQGNLAISLTPQDQLQCARITMAEEPPRPPLWTGQRYVHDRIRVAYLTADFRPHPVAFLIAGVFEHHDRNRVETIGVSFGPNVESDIRKRIASSFEHFFDVRNVGEAEIAARLKRMEVDIAVDLMGFTEDSRPGILAHRPVPVQVNFLGFPGTMGADHIDYILAHTTLIPEDEKRFYSEQIVYLPDTYQANDSKRRVAEHTPSRAEAGLPEQGFVFCCFNNNYKIGPDMFAIWMRLLRAVEGSVLWLLKDNDSAAANLRREAQAAGIVPERLIFAPRTTPAEHLARQRLADLFLDTSPYGAHTTCSDALWVGLPVVTFWGPTLAARVASNLLEAAGVPELAVRSPTDYENAALSLARDSDALTAIKRRLVNNRDTHPLFDTARFTRNLEAAYTTMRERQRAGQPPQGFAVRPIPIP